MGRVAHYVAEPPKVESIDISKFPLQASEIRIHRGSSAELSSDFLAYQMTSVCDIR